MQQGKQYIKLVFFRHVYFLGYQSSLPSQLSQLRRKLESCCCSRCFLISQQMQVNNGQKQLHTQQEGQETFSTKRAYYSNKKSSNHNIFQLNRHIVFISRLVSTREFPGFSTILNFSFLVSISRLVSFLEISEKMDVF